MIGNDLFQADEENGLTYTSFEEAFLTTLDHHAPIKKEILRTNENCFISKALLKPSLCVLE